jgi:hypothetical protein
MGAISASELAQAAAASALAPKYARDLDPESAAEILQGKLQQARLAASPKAPAPPKRGRDSFAESLAKTAGRTVVNMAVRRLFGSLVRQVLR